MRIACAAAAEPAGFRTVQRLLDLSGLAWLGGAGETDRFIGTNDENYGGIVCPLPPSDMP